MVQQDALDKIIDSMPAAGPSTAPKKQVTYDEFQQMLDWTPLFMRETPHTDEDDPVLQGLRSLMLDGDGDEVATDFKNHGNEFYAQRKWKDAVTAYTSGLDAKPQSQDIQTNLLNNRAAANLALKNYGAVLKDTGLIIVLSIQSNKMAPVKALYRAAQALVALERWSEAQDIVSRVMETPGEGTKSEWKNLEEDIGRGQRRDAERTERLRREKLGKRALRDAIESRGLVVVNTPSPPDNPHPPHFDPGALPPAPPLHVDPSSDKVHEPWTPPASHTTLVFPMFLLYPEYSQSDLITQFSEETSLSDHLGVMFPPASSPPSHASPPFPEWDVQHEYSTDNLVIYVETAQKRLLKVGKELTLREVISKAVKRPAVNDKEGKQDGVILRDGLLSFILLVKGDKERKWIEEYKSKLALAS